MTEPSTVDCFALFGLPSRYPLEREELDRRYAELQRRLHPDNYVTASAAERTAALSHSSRVNDAYRVLCSPVQRARHLLSYQGAISDDELAEGTVTDSTFLMEQLAVREQIETLGNDGDQLGLQRLAQAQMEDFVARSEDFGDAIAEGRTASALELFRRMQFLDRQRRAAVDCAASIAA